MIRKIEKSDRETYLSFVRDFYSSEAVAHPIPGAFHELTFDELMRSGDYVECFIVEHEGRPAGYGLLSKTFSQEAGGMVLWVEEAYIMPEFRSAGLGKELFAYIDEFAASNKFARLRLEIEPDNERAKRLYLSLGYEPLVYKQMVKEQADTV